MTWFGGGRVRPSDSRSIYIAFGLLREPFGQSTTPPTCAVSRTCLVHASFDTTEGHYIMAQSRIAGRALAHVVGMLRK